jgi:glycerol kinase
VTSRRPPRLVLALDQGTTSSRALVFDRDGDVVALAQQEHPQSFPKPGWVEHDPAAIWRTQLSTARAALAKARVSARDVAAIGIANQRETTIVWERATGRAIHPAIVWQCRRTADRCAQLRRRRDRNGRSLAHVISRKSGLVVDAYFSATKVAWILDHVRGARRRARRGELAFGTVDSWLLWNLTKGRVHATDPSNASRTMLFDLRRGRFDDELLNSLCVPREVLPEVRPSSGLFGASDRELFGSPIPVTGVAGDQQAALFGQCCFAPGTLKCTFGTGAFLLLQTGAKPVASRNGLLTTVAWSRAGDPLHYALEGSVFVAGAAVQWLRDGLGVIERSSEVRELAASVPDSGGVVFVPAFVGLGAPHWDSGARGAILGLTRGSTKAHLARATLEAIAFQTRDLVDAMERDARAPIRELRVDGGAARDDLLCQIVADLTGRAVVRPRQTETTALGAAFLAGLAVGLWRDERELATRWRLDRRFEPTLTRRERDARHAPWLDALERVRSARGAAR